MKVLVTGATGFLGSRLVKRLVADGVEVVAISRGNIPNRLATDKNVTWIKKDLSRETLEANEIDGVDTAFHLAGATLGARLDEEGYLSANELTTLRVLQSCSGKVKKIIHASSQVVYGDAAHTSVTEDFPQRGEGSAYACSKINSENWLSRFQKKDGTVSIALRLSGFLEGGGIVDYLVDRATANESIELLSRGEVRRDYLEASVGIDAFIAAMMKAFESGFYTFNIGSGQAMSSFEMAKLICAQLGSSSKIILSDAPAPQRDFVFNIRKATSMLGFRPRDLQLAIQEYARRRNRNAQD